MIYPNICILLYDKPNNTCTLSLPFQWGHSARPATIQWLNKIFCKQIKFSPQNFCKQNKHHLQVQLQHFHVSEAKQSCVNCRAEEWSVKVKVVMSMDYWQWWWSTVLLVTLVMSLILCPNQNSLCYHAQSTQCHSGWALLKPLCAWVSRWVTNFCILAPHARWAKLDKTYDMWNVFIANLHNS